MVSTSIDHAWLARTLEYPVNSLNDNVEEMAFHIAQDLDWLEDYKRNTLERLQNAADEARILEPTAAVLGTKTDSSLNSVAQSFPQLKDQASNISTMVQDEIEPAAELEPSIASHTIATSDEDRACFELAPSSESRDISDEAAVREASPAKKILTIDIQSSPLKETEMQPDTQRVTSPIMPLPARPVANTNMIPLKIIGRHMSSDASQHSHSDTALEPVHQDLPERKEDEVTPSAGPNQLQLTKMDYMEPINLDSPKKTDNRNDSAYFSAVESPDQSILTTSSPRRSVAFASLPPRQPFAKKSMGARPSQSRASAFDSRKVDDTVEEAERAPLDRLDNESVELDALKSRPQSHTTDALQRDVCVPTSIYEIEPTEPAHTHDTALDQRAEAVSKQFSPKRFLEQDAHNPFDTEKSPVRVDASDAHMEHDDDWPTRITSASKSPDQKSDFKMPLPVHTFSPKDTYDTGSHPTNQSSTKSIIKQEDKTPGPIKAAMQAASAKATSYLRQARTAFGSPSINHTKVFPTTTPAQSPTKPRFKVEPQTPKIYPDLSTPAVNTKPSLIPSRSPRKSPVKPIARVEDGSLRKSPRRSPKKGGPAMQSMAVMAARSASAKAATLPDEDKTTKSQVHKSAHDSPQKVPPKPHPKYSLQPKAKPLSIRVATASQREIDNTKERKTQPSQVSTSSGTSILSRSVGENGQLEYLNKSQTGNVKKAGVSRQIKALAAANQAKEKAEKEQTRREQQRKEIERKRHEIAKRQAEEEEKRKIEADEASRKRKAAAEQRSASASSKKHVMRPITTNANREPQVPERQAVTVTTAAPAPHVNRQSIKRPLVELEEAATTSIVPEIKRQRVSEQAESRSVTTTISKPVRVSLQKPSHFGQPGEPGYKKPGTTFTSTTTNTTTKPVPVVDAVKFSTETIRFATQSEAPVKHTTNANLPPSESIELPEINSDYSDSDDDGADAQKDTFEKPGWAETPELRKLLRRQQRIDPDEVFGPIPPLQMEEIFKGKERALARFRPRSSSANWSASDKLSNEEVTEYARAMGYRN